MHEKIKELANKAGFVMWEEDEKPWNDDVIDWSSTYDKELQEYTKLVVLECAKVARQDILSRSGMNQQYDGRVITEDAIKKHFGIE
jgi:hypothetical protein